MRSRSGRRRGFLLCLLIALLGSGVVSSSAPAAILHTTDSSSFGPDGTAGSAFGGWADTPKVNQLTINQATDRLYVVNVTNPSAVYGFDVSSPATHAPLAGFPFSVGGLGSTPDISVDDTSLASAGRIYLVMSQAQKVAAYTPGGVQLWKVADPSGSNSCGVGADANGYVWISSYEAALALKYDSSGNPTSDVVSVDTFPCALLFDRETNDLYVPNSFGGGTYIFSAASGYQSLFVVGSGGNVGINVGFALDSKRGLFYVANTDNGGHLVADPNVKGIIRAYDTTGALREQFGMIATPTYRGIAVDEHSGAIYVADAADNRIHVFTGPAIPDASVDAPTTIHRNDAELSGHVGLDAAHGGGNVSDCYFQYAPATDTTFSGADAHTVQCTPDAAATPFSADTDVSASIAGLTKETDYHFRLAATNSNGTNYSREKTFTTQGDLKVQTDAATAIAPTDATLNGSLDSAGEGVSYRFDYGPTTNYGLSSASADGSSITPFGPAPGIEVSGLEPHSTYHYRMAATLTSGPLAGTTVFGADQTFATPAAPGIASLSSAHVGADSADLVARIATFGADTTYHFEYGLSLPYDHSTPDQPLTDSAGPQQVSAHISGLSDAVYHFRLVASNAYGDTQSLDQTFSFHPPPCPNQALRQQTKAAYLPDCRAYELVSPEDAGQTVLFPGGPQRPYASSPPRLAFTGLFGEIPGAGSPVNTTGDLYVSTRGANGWSTKYVGPHGGEVGCVGGRPQNSADGFATTVQNDAMANADLSRVIDWNLGNPVECFWATIGASVRPTDLNTGARASNAPYLWDSAEDIPLDRWPTAVADVPGSTENFECPQIQLPNTYSIRTVSAAPAFCTTYVSASGDLRHFVFSTQQDIYGGGADALGAAPGSAYDNDTQSNALSLISELPGGGPIPQESPSNGGPEELIQFPHVSEDGSHILMGTKANTQCRQLEYPVLQNTMCPMISQPTHLYMRVNDAVTYDVSGGVPVTYLDSTPDGRKVYFTTPSRLLPGEDTDSSVDLYMWSDASGTPTLTLVSKGANGEGNSDACNATWTQNCDTVPYSDSKIVGASQDRGGLSASWWVPPAPGSLTGASSWQDGANPGFTDNALATDGDIVFYSPERLDGTKGFPGSVNVYEYRGGAVHFVTTLDDNPYCLSKTPNSIRQYQTVCSDGPLGRLQVTPDGRYLAFATTTNLTPYDSQGFAEMYRYDADTGGTICVSCRPDGEAPTSSVIASQGGRFLADDGRTFFYTTDPLDPRDTNAGSDAFGGVLGGDVYEYVDGRPQLISTGTGTDGSSSGFAAESGPGLYGVSADGTDVYFSTTSALVGQDRNGPAVLRFYDARTNGGFPFVPPAPPCQAADECHGASSSSPAALAAVTGADLGSSGNYSAPVAKKAKHRKRKHRAKKHGKHRAKHHRRLRHPRHHRAR